jgi:TRAP-type mannitol/chloroaromatic compound transport system permease large subunit
MTLALIGFAAILVLSFAGFPLGFATLAVGLTGFAFTRGWDWHAAFTMMSQQIVETGGSYGLSVIPLFILMGVFIHRSNISEDLYKASYALVGTYRGGLAQSTVLACAAFSPRVMPWKPLVNETTWTRPVTLRASLSAASMALVPVGPGNITL